MATAAADGGGAAAALPWGQRTVIGRLLEQLGRVGVARALVITRPAWEAELERALAGVSPAAELRTSPGVPDDLRLVAEIARESDGPLVLLYGDMVTHGEPLAGLLTDPGAPTTILTKIGSIRGMPFGTRADRARVVAAASPYHTAGDWDAVFLGALKVGAGDRPALIEAAETLAALAEPPLPDGWEDELRRKEGLWRLWLARKDLRSLDGTENGSLELDPARVPLSDERERELRRRVDAARDDVVSLLLVGLVRAGVAVGTTNLRGFFWARVLSDEAAGESQQAIAGYDEERLRLDAAVKPWDGFFTTFFVSPYSKYIARWAARRGWTPNLVTTLSMGVGALAAAAFATGGRAGLVAGALLLQAAFTLDCVDGQLARYTRNYSRLGAWLDSVFDRGKEYLVYAGLAVGSSRGLGDDVWALAAGALALQTARHMLDFSFGTAARAVVASMPQPPLDVPGAGQHGDGSGAGGGRRPLVRGRRRPLARLPARLARRSLRRLGAVDELPWTRWPRKILVFPIGERFAAISLTAALFSPRTTFTVLLAWGGLAAVYAAVGRVLRALAGDTRLTAAHAARTAQTLLLYRDDGPLARALGGALAARLRVSPPLALIVGAAPLAALLAADGDRSAPAVVAALAWLVLLGGLSSGRPHGGRAGWTAPPLVRLLEYGFLLWFALLAGGAAVPACFALLCALAFRHYDAVYRFRHSGAAPAPLIRDLGGGWEGRLALACALLLAGGLAEGLYAAAAVLALASVTESVIWWARFSRDETALAYAGDDEE